MGVKDLWMLLKDEGCVKELTCSPLLTSLEGKTIAVDVSTWLMEAHMVTSFSHEHAHIKTLFDRTVALLRTGALPVMVIEGRAPVEKAATMAQRYPQAPGVSRSTSEEEWRNYLSRGPSENSNFRRMGRDVMDLMDAMGVPFIEAQGEAEATCACLNARGLVDGVATNDGDALLLGGRVIYKGLRVSTAAPCDSSRTRAEVCDMAQLEAKLGISRYSLLALALLCGSDFNPNGARAVGGRTALEAVKLLKQRLERQGRVSEGEGLLTLLEETLTRPVDEALLAAPGGCSTCTQCRHGGVRKQAHGAAGCAECGTQATSRGGSGKGGCRPYTGGGPCPCGPCQNMDERKLHALARKAQQTKHFLARFRASRQAYAQAVQAVQLDFGVGEHFTWHRRPSVPKLLDVLSRFYGNSANLTKMILPLLLEWEVRHAGRCLGEQVGGAITPQLLQSAQDFCLLYIPRAISQESKLGAAAGGGEEPGYVWRYIIDFHPVSDEARQLTRDAAKPRDGSVDHRQGDTEPCLTDVLSAEKRSIRKSLIDRLYPCLVAAREDKLLDGKKRTGTRAPVKTRAGASSRVAGYKGRTLEDFFGPRKTTARATGGDAKGGEGEEDEASVETLPPSASEGKEGGGEEEESDDEVVVVEEGHAAGQPPPVAGPQPMHTPTKSDSRFRINEAALPPPRPQKRKQASQRGCEHWGPDVRKNLEDMFGDVEAEEEERPSKQMSPGAAATPPAARQTRPVRRAPVSPPPRAARAAAASTAKAGAAKAGAAGTASAGLGLDDVDIQDLTDSPFASAEAMGSVPSTPEATASSDLSKKATAVIDLSLSPDTPPRARAVSTPPRSTRSRNVITISPTP